MESQKIGFIVSGKYRGTKPQVNNRLYTALNVNIKAMNTVKKMTLRFKALSISFSSFSLFSSRLDKIKASLVP